MDDSKTKKDDGKVPIYTGCVARFPLALREVAIVSQENAVKKYNTSPGDMGYLEVENGWDRYSDALLGHMMDDDPQGGKRNPSDYNVYHAAQVAWCALARLEMMIRRSGDVASVRDPFTFEHEEWDDPTDEAAAMQKALLYSIPRNAARTPEDEEDGRRRVIYPAPPKEGEVGYVAPGHERRNPPAKPGTVRFSGRDGN